MKNLLTKAINFAKVKHEGQTRKGSNIPYITHIVAVAKILEEENADIKTIIVGVLHDTLEDTNTTIDELTDIFGVEIAYMVDTLSEKKSLKYEDRKHMQALRVKYAEKRIKMVKCADCLSNLRDTQAQLNTPNFWSRFNAPKEIIAKHYLEAIEAIEELQGTKMYNELKMLYEQIFTTKKITRYCTDCIHMDRITTPDPYDWFCDDDQRYVCKISGKTLSEANRPYEKQPTPPDCPLER